jgi:hypothetical protein
MAFLCEGRMTRHVGILVEGFEEGFNDGGSQRRTSDWRDSAGIGKHWESVSTSFVIEGLTLNWAIMVEDSHL